ncbi:MAG: hypothetical protein AMXMBFR56_53260 [Polyangiaceae bacterium]
MGRIRTPWDRVAEVDRDAPSDVLPTVNALNVNYIDPVAPAPPSPRPEPRARFEARIRPDGAVSVPADLITPVLGAVLGWWRDQHDPSPQPPAPSAAPSKRIPESSAFVAPGQAQDISGVLDGVAAVLRAELRAAVVEAIGSTSSEPEDTSHLTARELAERLRVHVETIRRWSKQPGFPVRRIGPHAVRFDLEEVCAWRRTGK